MPTNQNNTSIKTLSRAMILLDELRESDVPLGVNELAKKCDMNPSTVFRILKTFMQGAWVHQCDDDRYIIGPRLSYVTERKDLYFALKEISVFTMNRVSTQESQAMNLAVRKGNEIIILQQSRSTKLIDLIPPVNSILPIHASASGKIILAGMSDPLLEFFLDNINFERYTENTVTDKAAFKRVIEKVRQDGYALDCHESLDSAYCIAVPIVRDNGECFASLSFSGIIGSFDKKILNHYLPILHSAADEISKNVFTEYQGL